MRICFFSAGMRAATRLWAGGAWAALLAAGLMVACCAGRGVACLPCPHSHALCALPGAYKLLAHTPFTQAAHTPFTQAACTPPSHQPHAHTPFTQAVRTRPLHIGTRYADAWGLYLITKEAARRLPDMAPEDAVALVAAVAGMGACDADMCAAASSTGARGVGGQRAWGWGCCESEGACAHIVGHTYSHTAAPTRPLPA